MSLQLSWQNRCQDESWARGSMFYDGIAEGHMSQLPADSIQNFGGDAAMIMSVTGQDILNKGVMYCTWQLVDPKDTSGNHFWFSIRLTQPFNIGHAGWSAYWELATGVGPLQPPGQNADVIPADSWRTVVSSPGTRYILSPAADQVPAKLKVQLTPVAGGEDLSVSVDMSNL